MILGIDVGYSHTKVFTKDGEFVFKSTIEEGILDVCNSIQVEYDNKEYTIGENSNNSLFDNSVNKIDSLNFKLCLYTAIAKAMKDSTVEDVEIVTGLPASYYSSQKNELIEDLKGRKVNIVLNGIPKRFTIREIIVFPQSAGVLLLNPEKLNGDTCVIDVGGYTVDVSYFNNKKLKKLDTIELGMNILAKDLMDLIKSEHQVTYDVLRADDILDSKIIIKNNKEINIEDLIDKVLAKHTKLVINRLQGIKEYNISKHVYIGGGSLRLGKYLKESLDKDVVYTNAKAFYMLGVNKLGKN